MTTSLIFDKAIACAEAIKQRFAETGKLVSESAGTNGVYDCIYESSRYRRAHISIVDARESKKLWLLHVTVFPHTNDNSPIYGFDIVAGPNKVSGAFHDFSNAGDPKHAMLAWFATKTANLEWNKKRELPEWAKNIFSDNMVAIGAVGPEELDNFVAVGLQSLNYYLEAVGNTQQDLADYHMAQNRYCYYQKQNPHTPRVLVNLGFTEEEATAFVQHTLFPEVG
jgi:hypothetical protein